MSVLTVRQARGGYGEADILNGASLQVGEREIVVVIGPNGAGKSTLMKAVFGLVRLREGQVLLGGEDVTNAKPESLVPRGLSYVPQEKNVFPSLTVEENLEMGAFVRRDDWRPALERVYALFPPLAEKRRIWGRKTQNLGPKKRRIWGQKIWGPISRCPNRKRLLRLRILEHFSFFLFCLPRYFRTIY